MKGRKPIPTALKLIHGNPGRRPLPIHEFVPEPKIPDCPEHLNGEARKEWDRITPELLRYGLISDPDRAMVAMMCTTWARYCEAERMVERTRASSDTAGSANRYPAVARWMTISARAMELYKSLSAEFGLSPASRPRVVARESQNTAEASASGWAQFDT